VTVLIAAPDDAPSATAVADTLDFPGEASVVVPGQTPVRLTPPLREVLSAAARAFAAGKEVVVGAQESYLTTQEAADFLGVSRPTMVKLLESGQVPFERPGHHRRVRLGDLAAYEVAERARRRVVLDQMSDDFADLSRQPESFVDTR